MDMINRYSYTLNRDGLRPDEQGTRYYKQALELMTTHQLREICRKEKIIHGVVDPMDKDDLIRVILRYRGAEEALLIKHYDEEGSKAVAKAIHSARLQFQANAALQCSAKIVVYNQIAVDTFDGIVLQYNPKLVGTNALVVGADSEVCSIFNVEQKYGDTTCLYLTKTAELPCNEFHIKNYSLYCFDQRDSALLYRIYCGESYMPENLTVYRVPLLDFEVREPLSLNMPLAIDFGTSNTTAGVYLDSIYFEQAGDMAQKQGFEENGINYVLFCDASQNGKKTALLPTVVGVLSIDEGVPKYLFGYEAMQMANASYIDEGFCVFYDIKRWIGDYEKTEEITDRSGKRTFVKRKEIIKAYLEYIIRCARERFKCRIDAIHISCPVKQKHMFQKLFTELFADYVMVEEDMLDEGVSVIYNTISEMIENQTLVDGREYKALLFDCGGGTTDLCSCTFRVYNRRIAYQIEIETSYENGDTDFGGNNLTYRIMQLLKVQLASAFEQVSQPVQALIRRFDMDVYRFVDENGPSTIYAELEKAYMQAESVIPTRFHDYENMSRLDYYKVKNNFYFLFETAERIKKEFFNKIGTMRIMLSNEAAREPDTVNLLVDKWKLTVRKDGRLETVKEFPKAYFRIFDINLLLKADIYGILHKFLEPMYLKDELFDYSIIKLTGQSCKIDLFRSALKEYVPGKVVKFRRQSGDLSNEFGLKMACIDGTLKYLKDKKYGFADIKISSTIPALPYVITAYTHTGQETTLIRSFDRHIRSGQISRNMDNLTLKLYLKDINGEQRYSYTYNCALSDFVAASYEEIRSRYGKRVMQDDTDSIVDREVKFFVWPEQELWGFMVVPIYQSGDTLMLGREEFFPFENDNWVQNFFDGTK